MSWIDLVIVVVVIVATDRGLTLGIFRQLGALVGFISGFVGGTLLVPLLVSHVGRTHGRVPIAVVVVVVTTLIGTIIGRQLGNMAKLSLRRLKLGAVDRIGGAIFAVAGSLIGCWLVAGLLTNASFTPISGAISNSKLLAVMDAVMPPVPAIESKVQALLRSTDFPSVFATVVSPTVPSVSLPDAAATAAAVGNAANSVLKITSLNACGIDREGTAFVVAPGIVITAAHVVAGASSVIVGQQYARTLVFDPQNDVAILAVATGSVRALTLTSSDPSTGTPAAVVGYPLNGSRLVSPAAVAGEITAQGRDIYNSQLVTRTLIVVNANVRPGNSGSPLLVGGVVGGMVFSKSVTQNSVGYAVPNDVLRADFSRANSHTTVARGACLAD